MKLLNQGNYDEMLPHIQKQFENKEGELVVDFLSVDCGLKKVDSEEKIVFDIDGQDLDVFNSPDCICSIYQSDGGLYEILQIKSSKMNLNFTKMFIEMIMI